jgi:hypothetical protein
MVSNMHKSAPPLPLPLPQPQLVQLEHELILE